MQCYVVLYSQEGYFIIFEKREKAFFFHSSNQSGTIYPPDGITITNGGGLYAFPGGKLDTGEEPFKGCLREFREECGNSITFGYTPVNQPQSLVTLSSVTIDTAQYNILLSLLHTVENNYYTLYLEFTTNNLRQIQNIITNTNFDQANQARRDIHYNEIRSYNEIFEGYPFCPLDDELGFSELWLIDREINEIRRLKDNQATDWYYDMIMYLANDILDKNIS
ncbi:NUDIX domain-containing protein [Aquimarina rhabdastrellae]